MAEGMSNKLNFACVSGNNAETYNETTSAWNEIAQVVSQRKVNYLFHLGSFVCLDAITIERNGEKNTVASHVMEILKANKANTKECEELVRQAYRKTFQFPPLTTTLANVPNIFLPGEGENYAGYGTNPAEDTKEDSLRFLSTQITKKVFYEYLRLLRIEDKQEDSENANKEQAEAEAEEGKEARDEPVELPREYFSETFNGITFVFLDFRSIKGWHFNDIDVNFPGYRMLGTAQWKWLEGVLESEDFVRYSRRLVVFSPFPPLLVGEESAGFPVGSLTPEQWQLSDKEEQLRLFKSIQDWAGVKPGEREAVVVGGDIQWGLVTDVVLHRGQQMTQVVVSPLSEIGYKIKQKSQFEAVPTGKEAVLELKGGLRVSFSHKEKTSDYNFAIVEMVGEKQPKVSLRKVERVESPVSKRESPVAKK